MVVATAVHVLPKSFDTNTSLVSEANAVWYCPETEMEIRLHALDSSNPFHCVPTSHNPMPLPKNVSSVMADDMFSVNFNVPADPGAVPDGCWYTTFHC